MNDQSKPDNPDKKLLITAQTRLAEVKEPSLEESMAGMRDFYETSHFDKEPSEAEVLAQMALRPDE